MKFLHLLLVVSHFLAGYLVSAVDFEVAEDGTGFLFPTEVAPNSQEISATFYNHYVNDALSVYWQGNDGEEVIIGEIGPSSSMDVNTYNYHTFFARFKDTSLLANPKTVSKRIF